MVKIKIEVYDNHIALYNDENEVVGNLDFVKMDNVLVCTHTVVNPALQGRGYANLMFKKLIEYAKTNNYKIRPICSYIVKRMQEPQYNEYLEK